jgi:uncharacterized protein YdeI (YjbR/CyaY-like superfamily)
VLFSFDKDLIGVDPLNPQHPVKPSTWWPGMPRSFKAQDEFRAWLEKNHATEKELILRCYKVHAKDRGIGYRESLDEALCFGWIDGVRHGLDDDSFTTRYTPRKSKSYWSKVNIKRANELEAEGRMHPAGLAAFRARAGIAHAPYSFESPPMQLTPAFERKFRANKSAWAFFQAQAPWYKRTGVFWVMSAKKDETRERRLAALFDRSARRVPVGLLRRPEKKKKASK